MDYERVIEIALGILIALAIGWILQQVLNLPHLA